MIVRRAIRFADDYLKAPEGFFSSLVPIVVDLLGDAFPEIRKDPAYVMEVLSSEEKQFRRTLVDFRMFWCANAFQSRGQRMFNRAAEHAKDGQIDGSSVWQLWGTYGFPVDLTRSAVNFSLASHTVRHYG